MARVLGLAVALSLCPFAHAEDPPTVGQRATRHLVELIRRDTTNPPGNESRAARYLKQVADAHAISSELLGDDPARLNFVARLRGSGRERPLLLMAHTDVVPADRGQWTADPYAGEIRDGMIYGRGAQDTKNLLAAELAVLVELKRRGVKLNRDVILLGEADEEAGSSGMRWLVRYAWPKIDAEFALNESGMAFDTAAGTRVFQVQTLEKIPTRMVLTARGTAGHGSLPRPDNPVVRLSRAVTRLADAEQPVRLNTTTRNYFQELVRLAGYKWLAPLADRLEDRTAAASVIGQIRARDPELEAMLRTSVSPTMLRAGEKINIIPNTAEAQIDVRRLPDETREEILMRFRRIVNDSSIEIRPAGGQEMPATEPSSQSTALYRAMRRVLSGSHPRAVVVPYMARGATDGSYLRQKGMAVYGVPVFLRDDGENRSHGNDERIAVASLEAGTELLWKIVLAVAVE